MRCEVFHKLEKIFADKLQIIGAQFLAALPKAGA
jgi:hypothetical protein